MNSAAVIADLTTQNIKGVPGIEAVSTGDISTGLPEFDVEKDQPPGGHGWQFWTAVVASIACILASCAVAAAGCLRRGKHSSDEVSPRSLVEEDLDDDERMDEKQLLGQSTLLASSGFNTTSKDALIGFEAPAVLTPPMLIPPMQTPTGHQQRSLQLPVGGSQMNACGSRASLFSQHSQPHMPPGMPSWGRLGAAIMDHFSGVPMGHIDQGHMSPPMPPPLMPHGMQSPGHPGPGSVRLQGLQSPGSSMPGSAAIGPQALAPLQGLQSAGGHQPFPRVQGYQSPLPPPPAFAHPNGNWGGMSPGVPPPPFSQVTVDDSALMSTPAYPHPTAGMPMYDHSPSCSRLQYPPHQYLG